MSAQHEAYRFHGSNGKGVSPDLAQSYAQDYARFFAPATLDIYPQGFSGLAPEDVPMVQQKQQQQCMVPHQSPRGELLSRLRTHTRNPSRPAPLPIMQRDREVTRDTYSSGGAIQQDAPYVLHESMAASGRYDTVYTEMLQEQQRQYMFQYQQQKQLEEQAQQLHLQQQWQMQQQWQDEQQQQQQRMLLQQFDRMSMGTNVSPPGTPQARGPCHRDAAGQHHPAQRHAVLTPPMSGRKHISTRGEVNQPYRQPLGPPQLDDLVSQPQLNFAKRQRANATRILEAGVLRRGGSPASAAGRTFSSRWVPCAYPAQPMHA